MGSFWSMFKLGYYGTYHCMSPKNPRRYVTEFTGHHNVRQQDAIDQLHAMIAGLVGKPLMYRALIADSEFL